MEKISAIGMLTFSTFLVAALTPIYKKANLGIPPFFLMSVTMLSMFLLAIIAYIFFEKGFEVQSLTLKQWGALAGIGLIEFLAFWTWLLAIKDLSSIQIQMFMVLAPIFAAIAAYFLLGEKVEPKAVLGLVIMGAGLYVAIK